MLFLTRKRGQSIIIGDIRITVIEAQGRRVRLGIEAPPDVRVDRAEIAKKREQDNG